MSTQVEIEHNEATVSVTGVQLWRSGTSTILSLFSVEPGLVPAPSYLRCRKPDQLAIPLIPYDGMHHSTSKITTYTQVVIKGELLEFQDTLFSHSYHKTTAHFFWTSFTNTEMIVDYDIKI